MSSYRDVPGGQGTSFLAQGRLHVQLPGVQSWKLSQRISAGSLPSPLGNRLQRLIWGNEFCTFTECEIPQGHSCTRKEKSNPALSFRVLAVKEVNPIQFSRSCPRPAVGGGGSKSPSDGTLPRELEILGVCVAGCIHREGQLTRLSHQGGAQSLAIFLETFGGPGRCLLSDATVCNAVLGVEACGVAHGPADAHAQAALCPAPRREAFLQMCWAGNRGGARGSETFGSCACDLS